MVGPPNSPTPRSPNRLKFFPNQQLPDNQREKHVSFTQLPDNQREKHVRYTIFRL